MEKSGFTLIEVIVVAVLMSILALGVFTLFNMYSESARETSAHFKMQRQSEALMDEIARRTREANRIMPASASPENLASDYTPPEAPDTVYATGIVFYNNDWELSGERVSGFRFNTVGGVMFVEECIMNASGTACVWNPFRIDDSRMELCNIIGTDHGHTNRFTIVGRQQIDVNATFRTIAVKDTFHLTVERGIFRCRL